jgi:hypothetical protein
LWATLTKAAHNPMSRRIGLWTWLLQDGGRQRLESVAYFRVFWFLQRGSAFRCSWLSAVGLSRPDTSDKAMYNPHMNPNYTKRILWSLVFALAMVASALLFKGNPALYWIEAGLVIAALTFVILKSPRPAVRR